MSAPELVVTLADDGTVSGHAHRLAAHRPPGVLHLAVSVQLVDAAGRWLLQRRAPGKELFARQWANSCCTHPRPAETAEAAVRRRLTEELGLTAGRVVRAGRFRYRATDSATGLVEHELDHVFVALVDQHPTLDPDEVEDIAWLRPDDAARVLAGPQAAPWAAGVFRRAADEWLTLTDRRCR